MKQYVATLGEFVNGNHFQASAREEIEMKSSERRLLRALRGTMIGVAIPLTRAVTGVVVLTACLGLAPSAAFADLINGTEYAVLGLGGTVTTPSTFQIYQSATIITGNVGQGPFTGVTHGIDVSLIDGTWFYDPVNNCGGLPCIPGNTTPVSVTGTVMGGFSQMNMAPVVSAALAQSNAFAALAPTQTFATLTSGQTITLAPGQNVVAIMNAVTLSGGSTTLNLNCPVGSCSVVFQMLATGTVKNVLTLSGTTMNLMGGIDPANVVWNLNGKAFSASDTGIQITSSATVIGTFLAPNQSILVDAATVEGEVVGGGNGALLSIHSGSKVTAPILAVPDGGMTLMLLGGALVGLESLRRRFRV